MADEINPGMNPEEEEPTTGNPALTRRQFLVGAGFGAAADSGRIHLAGTGNT